jgi:signal transduction histidine kinase
VLKVTTRELGNEVEIRVRDNGTGIRPIARRLFQPFFTTKPTGEARPRSLISYIVTQRHGGLIGSIVAREFTELRSACRGCGGRKTI